MEFRYHDLGNVNAGATVRVTLTGSAANVLLLDAANFARYKAGQDHRYYGGHYDRSPVLLSVPHGGHWYVAVDLGGLAGSVGSAAEVLA